MKKSFVNSEPGCGHSLHFYMPPFDASLLCKTKQFQFWSVTVTILGVSLSLQSSYCQTSDNSKTSGNMLLPDVWQ